MSKLREDIRVKVCVDDVTLAYREGTIKSVFDDREIAIVIFSNGELGKVRYKDITVVDDEVAEQAEEKNQATSINISHDIFVNKFTKALATKLSFSEGMLGTVYCANISEKLFSGEDQITITKDELINEIGEVTLPSRIIDEMKKDGKEINPLVIVVTNLKIARVMFAVADELFNTEADNA